METCFMRKILFTLILSFALPQLLCAGTVTVDNPLIFDDHNFGLIHFDTSSQSTYSNINNNYLNQYNALMGSSGNITNGDSWAQAVSPDKLLVSGAGNFNITFNTPVRAVGFFMTCGVDNGHSKVSVRLADDTQYVCLGSHQSHD